MLVTRFTELIGCTIPIRQAGMGALANKQLAAAVANAGGQGMLSWGGMPADKLADTLDDLGKQTTGVFGVYFLIPGFEGFEEEAEVRECVRVAAARAKVIDFFYTDPVPGLVEPVHHFGALACW